MRRFVVRSLLCAALACACARSRPPPIVQVAEAAHPPDAAAARDCAQDEVCVRYGQCTPSGTSCVWGGDCKGPRGADQRDPCEDDAQCTLRDGLCVLASSADCVLSRGCGMKGECTLDRGRCVVASAADCAAPCKLHGRCVALEEKEAERVVPGNVWYAGLNCVARSAAQCRASEGCATDGLCALDENGGECQGGTSDDCARSELCRREGLCTAGLAFGYPQPRCVAKSEGLCQASAICAERGSCHLATQPPPVMMPACRPKSKADCEASATCKKEGFCTFDPSLVRCVVDGASDCKRADACTQGGRCRFLDDTVEHPCVAR